MHRIVLLIHWDAVINGNPVERVFFLYCTKSVLSRETSLIGCELVDKHSWIQERHTIKCLVFTHNPHLFHETSISTAEKKVSIDCHRILSLSPSQKKTRKSHSEFLLRQSISVVKWIISLIVRNGNHFILSCNWHTNWNCSFYVNYERDTWAEPVKGRIFEKKSVANSILQLE